MTEAERLSRFADIPLYLAQLVVMRVNATGYSLKFVRSGKRWDNLVDIRQSIAAEAREHEFSYPQIGRALNRDHTTIISLLRRRPPVRNGPVPREKVDG